MSRTMYDAVTVANIPSEAEMVAGYVDGKFANMTEMSARFPQAVHVPIAVFPSTNAGVVLDVEPGDARPDQAPGWVQMRRSAGVDPTVYCDSSRWPTVRAAFDSVGVAQPHYWIADFDGDASIPAGAVAKQYQSTHAFDKSVVADFWPGVDSAPQQGPGFQPFPGASFFTAGRRSPIIAAMHERLVAVGCNRYQSSLDKDVFGSGDVASYRAYQQSLGFSGADADGIPGSTSWDRLQVPRVV
ncbi:hypothetical protein GCM10010441_43290 [Kitasatospora paracochleata]|uniref:Peptidoglycan binding protein n=2 Tax=Kitasatospora paracochleata TaxID=58354 RepID=A0ABT1J0G1_9ACTN|nr:peptidoglycan-binding protein [Kitasatospora paracochleata]MCP2310887.1 hypothetical protein [Kitasatospora paracochleata]